MLGGYWAVLQDDQKSEVTRGENAGETLRNDHVVRLYQPVAPWAANQAKQHTLSLSGAAGQRVVFVVTQADGLKPVQAAALNFKDVMNAMGLLPTNAVESRSVAYTTTRAQSRL